MAIFKYTLIRQLARFTRISTFDRVQVSRLPMKVEESTAFKFMRAQSTIRDENFRFDHPEQERGNRVSEIFRDRIFFENFNHPKKNSDSFPSWLEGFKRFIEPFRHRRDTIIIATDSSLTRLRATSAIPFWRNGTEIHSEAAKVPAVSSFDTEIQALEMAFKVLLSHNASKILFLVDNEAAARVIWNTSPHNYQASSLAAMGFVRPWLSNRPHRNITVSWCPSHA
ncbi:hypothetical protein AX15_006531 [Amanita polypyramis BW_CC]|nr:hypothetical protein AX15_006531 [Amanita polypyramis BW_CC]